MSAEDDATKTKVIDWALRATTALALAFGAWYFNGINTNVSELTAAVNTLTTRLELGDQDRLYMQGRLGTIEDTLKTRGLTMNEIEVRLRLIEKGLVK